MDQAKKNPTVLLIRQTYSEEDSEAWLRLLKALKGFTQAELEIRDESFHPGELQEICAGFDHVIIDFKLATPAAVGKDPVANLVIASKDTFEWDSPNIRASAMPVVSRHPTLILEGFSAGDLIRTLHLLFIPKRLAGVTPVMEKGAVIVAEKVQSTDAIGSLIDKLCLYFERTESFAMGARLPDLRQSLQALILEAFRQAKATATEYPTVDFQVGITKNKIAVNLRFPRGALVADKLPLLILNGLDPLWHQAWACSDLMMITEHTQFNEIELILLFIRPQRSSPRSFRPLLTKKSDRSAKKENLFSVSTNYVFHVLSDIRLKEGDHLMQLAEEDPGDIDLGSLPEEIVVKLAGLTRESLFLKDQTLKKDELLREAHAKILQLNKSLGQKHNEFARMARSSAMKLDTLTRKSAELEKALAKANEVKQPSAATISETNLAGQAQETITSLQQSLRALENEKSQLNERANREQKKIAVLEQKYTTLYRDIGVKDKELAELKAQLIKLKKEANANGAGPKAAAAASTAQDAALTKLRETEAREFALKQELRKLAFKAENHDKNVKAIQQEGAEKAKLLEQKLQAAKAKELELIKKIEDLSGLLKKASKAA